MTRLIGAVAARLGVPGWLVATAAVLLLAAAGWGGWSLWLAVHDHDVVARHEDKVTARLERQGRAADQDLMARKAADEAALAEQRKEFDHATDGLPRTGLTARQHLDACNELRRQGEAAAVLARARCL